MARSLPKVCPFLVTVDLKLKCPELPRGPNYPALPYIIVYIILYPSHFNCAGPGQGAVASLGFLWSRPHLQPQESSATSRAS